MYFRPFFWLTFFSLPSLLVLLMLGFWQLDRLAWKTELIESFNDRSPVLAGQSAHQGISPDAHKQER